MTCETLILQLIANSDVKVIINIINTQHTCYRMSLELRSYATVNETCSRVVCISRMEAKCRAEKETISATTYLAYVNPRVSQPRYALVD